MKRIFGKWTVPVWVVAMLAAVTPSAWANGEELRAVQVSPSGFSVLWQAEGGAVPGISVFADEAGTVEITDDLRIEAFPLHTGNLYLPDGFAARGVRRTLEERMAESGSMLLRVSGCEPGTVYYFRGREIPLGGGAARILPETGPLPSVRTAEETGFVAGSRQLLVEFSRNDLAGRTVLLETGASPYGLAAVIGDGAGPNQAFFNLDDLVSADGKTTGGLTGVNDFSLTLFGDPGSRSGAETTLTFSGEFAVANAEVFTFGLDEGPVTVAGFAFDPVGPQTVGIPFTVTIRAVDGAGRTVTDFAEAVELSGTGNLSAGGGTTPPFAGGVLASYLVAVTDPGAHRLAVASLDGETVGQSGIFTVSTAYSFWQLANFPDEADRENPDLAGPGADPGGRGVPNLLRYAFYLNGKNPARDGLPTAGSEVLEDGKRYLTLQYRRAKGATDLTYLTEVGGGLTEWESGPGATEVLRVEDAGAWEVVTVRDLTPLEEAGSRFMRLRVGASATFAGWQGEQIAKGGGMSGDLSGYAPGALSPIDGIPNLLRYALGLEPDVYQRHMLPVYGQIEIEDERYVSLTFNRPKNRGDMDYVVEVSRNMTDWFSGPDYTEEVSAIDAGESETVTVRDRTSFNASDRRFIRLKVVRR